jgi:hypothetical protein
MIIKFNSYYIREKSMSTYVTHEEVYVRTKFKILDTLINFVVRLRFIGVGLTQYILHYLMH